MSREEEYRKFLEELVQGAVNSGGNFTNGTCCCGVDVEAHGYKAGHSPVDSGQLWFWELIKEIDSKLREKP